MQLRHAPSSLIFLQRSFSFSNIPQNSIFFAVISLDDFVYTTPLEHPFSNPTSLLHYSNISTLAAIEKLLLLHGQPNTQLSLTFHSTFGPLLVHVVYQERVSPNTWTLSLPPSSINLTLSCSCPSELLHIVTLLFYTFVFREK